MGYSLKDRKTLSKNFSKASEIEKYRTLLRGRGSRYAGARMADKEALAKMLYYELLNYYTVEEIEGGASSAPGITTPAAQTTPRGVAAESLKKKLTNSLSTLVSAGKRWMTHRSDLQTASSQTESTSTAD